MSDDFDNTPGWIQMIYKHGPGISNFSSYNARFHQRLTKDQLDEVVAGDPERPEQLRRRALELLGSEDFGTLITSLSCLMVVGKKADADDVVWLLSHRNAEVVKAAQTCQFELLRK